MPDRYLVEHGDDPRERRPVAEAVAAIGVRAETEVGLVAEALSVDATLRKVQAVAADVSGRGGVAEAAHRRLTTFAELASVAVFMASDQAGAMTGTVANLSGGAIVE